MTFERVILPELSCIALRYSGVVTTADVKRCSEMLWSDSLYDKSYDGIVDLTRATFEAHPSDIPGLVEFYSRPETSTGRWAMITIEPKATALGLLFKASALLRPRIEIFTSWENACGFLRVELSPSIFGGDAAGR